MKAMILCAGLGTRLRPVTEKRAKPAVPFLNVPLLGYSLFHLEQAGLRQLVINTHHQPESVRKAARVLAADQTYYEVHFSTELPRILDSGGGIWAARSWLQGDSEFLVANGDEALLFQRPQGLHRLLEFHRREEALATLLTTLHPDVGIRLNGVRVDNEGRVQEISVREPALDHFAGVFVFSERIWPRLEKASRERGEAFHIFKDVLIPAIKSGEKILAFRESNLLWLETSSIEAFLTSTGEALSHLVRGDAYGQELQQILKRFGAPTNVIQRDDGLILAAPDVQLGQVHVKGFAVIGYGARVEEGSVENCVVESGVQLRGKGLYQRQILLNEN